MDRQQRDGDGFLRTIDEDLQVTCSWRPEPPLRLSSQPLPDTQPLACLAKMIFHIRYSIADEKRGCLAQFLDVPSLNGSVPEVWHFSYSEFVSFSGGQQSWTAVVDGYCISFKHKGTWAACLVLAQRYRSEHPTNLERPDVVFVPGMIGPDGEIRQVQQEEIERYLRPRLETESVLSPPQPPQPPRH
ncbi:hypothetical protein V8C42DRAFT_117856 [Trichoderma barbatum]